MKLAVAFFCLTALTVSASDYRTLKINEVPTESRRFGIQGGNPIKIEKRPYTVSLEDVSSKQYLGTGALINNNWVITAAINVINIPEPQVIVRHASAKALSGGETTTIKKIVIHEGYNGTWKDDLALVQLSKPVKVSKEIKPVTLGVTLPKQGAQTVISGYGSTTYSFTFDGILREATIPFIPYTVCKNKYKKTEQSFDSKHFCASKQGVGACPLDWGDPLVYNNKLIGLFVGSLGDCGSTEYPGAYCDLTQYTQWIKNTIKH